MRTRALLSWILIGLTLSILLFSFGCVQKSEQVKVDFLYADWCGHCATFRPVFEKVAGEFGGQVNVTYWNEAARKTDNATAALYADYKNRGVFGGFPTMVGHGVKGESRLVGKRNESEVRPWLCAQFDTPPPACAGGRK